MASRADQWMMVGVVGLGAYVLYRLLETKPALAPHPADVPIVRGPLPPLAGPVSPPPGTLTVTAKDKLVPQFWYAGRLEVAGSALEGRTTDEIARSLNDLGFAGSTIRRDAPEAARLPLDVRVYDTPEAALKAGIPAWAMQNAGLESRWFLGRWTGQGALDWFGGKRGRLSVLWRVNVPKPSPVGAQT